MNPADHAIERGAGDAERTYEQQLAATGLATQLASPALMHALKGRLHNIALLTELLQKEASKQDDAAALRASVARRTAAVRGEIRSLHDQLQMLEALSIEHRTGCEVECDLRASLQALLPTTRFEAARRQIVVRLDVDPAVERIRCDPHAFQRLVLAFLTQAVRHCAERATLTVTARREGTETQVEFGCDRTFEAPEHALDRRLMQLLAQRLGARATDGDTLGIAFRSAA